MRAGIPISFGLFLLFWIVANAPGEALGQGQGSALEGEGPVSLEADQLTYDQETESYRAAGDVRLRKGHLTLLADQVLWNSETGEAVARGEVRVTEPTGTVTADRLTLDLDTGLGVLNDATIYLREGNFHLTGQEIEKTGENSYRVVDGTFTTCDGEDPSWKFSARKVDVTVGGYARARHVFFLVHDIPILYTPYFFYPVKPDRESGFLMPRYGYSEKRGVELSLAWFQVLGRNMDATFYLDYLSELGIGKGLEYRYIFGDRDQEGIFRGYHISGFSGNEDRYAIDWQHGGTLPGRVRLAADVEYVSNRDYFEDFGEGAAEYNKDTAESVIYLSRNWNRYNLVGQFKYTKDLERDNDFTLQRLPEIAFTAVRQRLGRSPFFFRFDTVATHFWREEGVKGQRLIMRPEISAVFQPGRMLAVEPRLGYRERFYWTSEEGPGYEQEGIYDFSTRVSSRFSRVFSLAGPLIRKVRHTIEPEAVYVYVPEEDQENLPFFDVRDRIESENRIAYALVNRLTARLEPTEGESLYHEFLYLRLSQEYDIRESRRDLLDPSDDREPFSDFRTELIVRPNRWSYLDLDSRFDVVSGDGLNVFNALAGTRDSAGNGLALEYRYRREDLEYLNGVVDVAWLRPVYLNYQYRHDLLEGRTLEQVLNLEYRAQCWSLFLTYRDRLEDTEYLLTFALTGIGKVAELGGSLGSGE